MNKKWKFSDRKAFSQEKVLQKIKRMKVNKRFLAFKVLVSKFKSKTYKTIPQSRSDKVIKTTQQTVFQPFKRQEKA